MKKITAALFMACLSLTIHAQTEGVSIGPNNTAPHASAMLEVISGSKGLLIPRISLTGPTDQTTIPSPAPSLLVFNSNPLNNRYEYWDNSTNTWVPVGGGLSLWTLHTNGTDIFRSSGNVAIGDNSVPTPLPSGINPPDLFVRGTAIFYSQSGTLGLGGIRIGEDDGVNGAGGHANEISCANDIDLQWAGQGDVRIGGYKAWNTGQPASDLYVYGNIAAISGNLTQLSDSNYKENITPLDTTNLLADLNRCNTYSYSLKNDTSGAVYYGVLAQEVATTFPILVKDMIIEGKGELLDKTYKMFDYNGLTSLLLEAVKKQQAVIVALEQRIYNLENP